MILDKHTITAELKAAGFLESGTNHYLKIIEEYGTDLKRKAISLADADKATDSPLEVTHDHVKQANLKLFGQYGNKKQSKLIIAGQVAEYALTAVVGAAASHLDKELGIMGFGIGLVLLLILVTTRLIASRGQR